MNLEVLFAWAFLLVFLLLGLATVLVSVKDYLLDNKIINILKELK